LMEFLKNQNVTSLTNGLRYRKYFFSHNGIDFMHHRKKKSDDPSARALSELEKETKEKALAVFVDHMSKQDLHGTLAENVQRLRWKDTGANAAARNLLSMASTSKALSERLYSKSVAISRFVALLKKDVKKKPYDNTYYHRYFQVLKRAFEHKNLDPKDPAISQAFIIAVKMQLKDVVRMMLALDNNGNPTARSVDVNARDPRTGRTALMYALDERYGMSSLRIEIVNMILDARVIDVNIQDKKGFAALHLAAMRLAVSQDPSDSGWKAIIQRLLAKGADPALKTVYGDTPLAVAHATGGDSAKTVLTGFSQFRNYRGNYENDRRINAWKYFTISNLPRALRNGHPSAYGLHGAQALHSAVKDERTKEAKAMLKAIRANMPFDLDSPGYGGLDGNTPLTKAIYHHDKELAKMLIEAGADVNARNNRGETPLEKAIYHGYEELAKMLIEAGADVNARNNRGKTPLMLTVITANLGLAVFVEELAKMLIQAGADVNARDNDGRTALDMAKTRGMANILAEAAAPRRSARNRR
jgi:ankyrin repeat protein